MAQNTTGAEVRTHIVHALEADMVGPFEGADAHATSEEVLRLKPSRWYLTGFLAPVGARPEPDPTDDDEVGAGDDTDTDEFAPTDPQPKQKLRMPASIGMSVLLPPGSSTDSVIVRVRYATYARLSLKKAGIESADAENSRKAVWKRVPRPAAEVRVPLDAAVLSKGVAVPDSGGVYIEGTLRDAGESHGLAAGTRALSLFVVNRLPVDAAPAMLDQSFIFQVCLEVEAPMGLVPRPNRRDERASEHDQRVLDLQFRDHVEFAVGHGVAVEVDVRDDACHVARTAFLPRSEVRRVVTFDQSQAETRMSALAALDSADAVRKALGPLPQEYADWIAGQRQIALDTDGRREMRDQLMDEADRARARIADGIELLATDEQARLAFTLANEAMAAAARQRNPERGEPRWRLFQLAFVLLNLCGTSSDIHPDRKNVELIFFPTGGGKTEAYLGVIAYALLLRRLRRAQEPDGGLGVAVLLRYTLRLLTLDQLGRAATLICALEQIRKAKPERFSPERFAIGLWVGRSATANTLADVQRRIIDYKNSTSQNALSPFPLTQCPWCTKPLTKDSFVLTGPRSKPTAVVVSCSDWRECPFSPQKSPDGLPVLFVDEQIYRELPCFIVATVDKFAMLPWRGETGMLFGRVSGREGTRFFGAVDKKLPKTATPLPAGLRPPELIVQDELHLISGPLGTMVGLYETAIEALCTAELPAAASASGSEPPPSRLPRAVPKILASTATVRRADRQIKALFNRDMTQFPPPGVNDSETFFATVDRKSHGRLYLGVAAGGRNMKAVLLRTYVTLLAAGAHEYNPKADPAQSADAYMSLVGYFNSLRELGGMRRLVEDEVRIRASQVGSLKPVAYPGAHPWLASRDLKKEPVELTSRESTGNIAQAKARLAAPYADRASVDVALASNMISVGVDIERLGLMVVAGQPKSTSEYIQASSRVGRQHPGLVVTVMNLHKSRDRSHYERFVSYHESFYRSVEATSLTPFSGPALERGLAGMLVGLTRHSDPELSPPSGFMLLPEHPEVEQIVVRYISERGRLQAAGLSANDEQRLFDELRKKAKNLFEAWRAIIIESRHESSSRTYSRYEEVKDAKPLLWSVVDPVEKKPRRDQREYKFAAPTSMRDVEPSVHLWLHKGRGLDTEGRPSG